MYIYAGMLPFCTDGIMPAGAKFTPYNDKQCMDNIHSPYHVIHIALSSHITDNTCLECDCDVEASLYTNCTDEGRCECNTAVLPRTDLWDAKCQVCYVPNGQVFTLIGLSDN